MRHLRQNLLLQFSVFGFGIMAVTAVAILSKTTAGTIGVGLIIQYLGLIFIVWQGGKTIRRQQDSLNRTNQELTRSNADLEQFASVASHDLKSPLTMITGYTQVLADRYKGELDAEADKYMAYTIEGSIRMGALIDDLLEYSRVGKSGEEFKQTDCEEVVNVALANLRGAIEESGAVVSRDPMPTVPADSQIGRVFQNIVGNAIKYRNQSPPEIHIGAEKVKGDWLFWVRDNGIGIESEHRARIFVPFQRLETESKIAGTGIGMAICKKIVEHHGGSIWVESQLGKGSTFHFSIPAVQANSL